MKDITETKQQEGHGKNPLETSPQARELSAFQGEDDCGAAPRAMKFAVWSAKPKVGSLYFSLSLAWGDQLATLCRFLVS